jgi:3-oxoacyl-[acyl-carrier-protein] synthase-3
VLFGDGAGAVVLEAVAGDRGVLATALHSDGAYSELLYQPGFGTRVPPTPEAIVQKMHTIKMQGNEVFKVAVRMLSEVALEVLEKGGVSLDDLSLLIPHQANRRILDATAKRLGLPEEKVYINVDRYGNTSAATIPIALDEAVRNGRIQTDDLLVLDAFGGGFTWGAALVRW